MLHAINDYVTQIPPCTSPISQNAPFRNLHTCTILLQNATIWYMGLVHCGIYDMGLLHLPDNPLKCRNYLLYINVWNVMHAINKTVAQFPKCTSTRFHNQPLHKMYTFSYKTEHCGIWDWCIVGFVRWAQYI